MRTCGGHHFRLRLLPALSLLCASGLTAQPAHLVKDIDDTTRDGGVYIQEMSAFGPSVYFGASAFSSFEQLWKSDGTTPGTWKLRDFDVVGGSQPHRFTRTASKLFFFVGRALWRLNAAGDASPVKELPTEPAEIAVLGDTLIMAMGEREVWRSDGTPAGTFRVANLMEQSYPSGLTSAGGFVYFFARDYAAATLQMWRTDGTEAGTRSQVELGPVGVWLSAALGDTLVFVAYSGVGDRPYTLLRSDGTAQGTTPIASFCRRHRERLPAVLSSVRSDGFHGGRRRAVLHCQRGRARARALEDRRYLGGDRSRPGRESRSRRRTGLRPARRRWPRLLRRPRPGARHRGLGQQRHRRGHFARHATSLRVRSRA